MNFAVYGPFNSSQTRQIRFSETYQRAMQILANNGNSNPLIQRRMRYRYGGLGVAQPAGPATLSSTQDDAMACTSGVHCGA